MPALLVAAVACAAAPGPASAAQRCNLRGAKTVLQNSQARVFSVPGKGKVKKRFYGCLRGKKPRRLTANVNPKDTQQTRTHVTRFRLAGTYVAWVETSSSDFGVGEFGRSIEVRGLKPRTRHVSVLVEDYDAVDQLAVRDDGAAAWILDAPGNGDYREVDAVESNRKVPTPLAYARGIDPKKLTFDETTVTWTQDGAPRSAPVR